MDRLERIGERRERLMRLGFTLEEVAERGLCFDDDLWEQAKYLPDNPDSEYSRLAENSHKTAGEPDPKIAEELDRIAKKFNLKLRGEDLG